MLRRLFYLYRLIPKRSALLPLFRWVRQLHRRLRCQPVHLANPMVTPYFGALPGLAWISKGTGEIVSANPAFAEMFGPAPVAPLLYSAAADTGCEAIRAANTSVYDMSLDTAKGERRHYRVLTGTCSTTSLIASVAVDISDLVKAAESHRFLAEHDSLTGLANRATLLKRLPAYLSMAKESSIALCVLFIDLDGFKEINDSLGHEAGDKLLVEIACRLRATVGTSDLICRHGGDEFILLNPNASDEGIAHLSERLLSAMAMPLVINSRQVSISASIGVARYPADAEDAAQLLKCADIAMYEAKRSGKNRFSFYVAEDMAISGRARISIDLRQAIRRSEFSLHYQPQYDLRSRLMVGVESLLVWRHPDLGSVPPSRFIPIAEESELILEISRWVLHEACACGRSWLDAGVSPFTVAVNISPRHLRCGDLAADVAAAVQATGFPAHLLELEITEGILLDVTRDAVAAIERLRALGVNIAIDDFGVGYSSLDYLARLPVDKIKLDRSLVANITDAGKHASIAKAVITLCKSLGMTVLAEGIESAWHVGFLAANGCDEGQGYFFARPMGADDLLAMMRLSDDDRSRNTSAGDDTMAYPEHEFLKR